ncbi:MAG TPA: hypothetical protein V6D33_12400 [Cyanophyceae cyanobacterium]
MYHYDERHYQTVAEEILQSGKCAELVHAIGHEQMLNYVSTVFYTEHLEIAPGHESPKTQSLMRQLNYRGLVGLTPKFPIFHPAADDIANAVYVRYFAQKMQNAGVLYVPCMGRARDYRDGGNGCFILIDVLPHEAMRLLEEDGVMTQYAIAFLPPTGKAQLISCVERQVAAVA